MDRASRINSVDAARIISAASLLIVIIMTVYSPTQSSAVDSEGATDAGSNQDGAESMLLYEDDEYGIKVSYPATWDREIRNEGSIVVFFSPESEDGDGDSTLEHLALYADRGPSIDDLETYSEELIKRYSGEISGFHILERNNTTLAGGEAQQLVFEATDESGVFQVMDIWTLRNSVVYHAVLYSDPEDFQGVLATVKAMIDSLEILPVSLDRPITGGAYELPSLGLEIHLPDTWRGYETYESGSIFSFVSPPEVYSDPSDTTNENFAIMFILIEGSDYKLQKDWQVYGCEHVAQATVVRIGELEGIEATTSCQHPKIKILKFYEFASSEKGFIVAYGASSKGAFESYEEFFDRSVLTMKLASHADPSEVGQYAQLGSLELTTQPIFVGEESYGFGIASNSPIRNATLDEDRNALVLDTEGGPATGAELYLRPSWFLHGPFIVSVDDKVVEDGLLIIQDNNGYSINLIYNGTDYHRITIAGTSVVPEFSMNVSLMLAIVVVSTILVTGIFRIYTIRMPER